MSRAGVLLALAACAAPPAPPAPAPTAELDGAAALARFAALAGDYDVGDGSGAAVVAIAVLAGRQAVREEWTWPSGKKELTVFFLDHGTLRATHYCHSGVQSTMILQAATADQLVFHITAAANLSAPTADHNTGFGYHLGDPARLLRDEEWLANGRIAHSQDVLRRRPPPDRATRP